MSKKHVEDYYLKMVSDYTEMKEVLQEVQKAADLNPECYSVNYIHSIKEKVQLLESNYKRLSYIMFLLNMPNRKDKVDRYIKREHKKLDNIPEKDRRNSIEEENHEVIHSIKNML